MSKRPIFYMVLGLLLISLIACGGGGDATDPDTDQGADPDATVLAPTATPAGATEVPSATPLATEGDLFLQLVEPAETEVFTNVGSLTVAGRTRVDAVVTINDTIVEPNIDGEFSLDVPLEEGPNIIEVVASVASGEQLDQVLVAIYVP